MIQPPAAPQPEVYEDFVSSYGTRLAFRSFFAGIWMLGDSTMPSTNFEERATECIKLAEATDNYRDREFYLMLASAWRGLAESEDDDLWRNQNTSRH